MTIKNTFIHIFISILSPLVMYGAIANHNHFPTLKPSHVLDEQLSNISFAFSMRVLESDYNGPLIRLRRASDNAEQDFDWSDNDIVDINSINAWRNGSNVYMVIWYDQSGLGQNAVQNTMTNQPRFYPDTHTPYFQGDGVDDHLTIVTPNGIQDVTNNGNEGTVLTIMYTTARNQHSFGVLTGGDRWSIHGNWSNNTLYFDPGVCCNNPRSFLNSEANWAQYTFVKTSTNIVARKNSIEKLNATHTTGRCTRTEDFAIGWATGNEPGNHATTAFLEFIMYKIDINSNNYQEIEANSMTFWSL